MRDCYPSGPSASGRPLGDATRQGVGLGHETETVEPEPITPHQRPQTLGLKSQQAEPSSDLAELPPRDLFGQTSAWSGPKAYAKSHPHSVGRGEGWKNPQIPL